MKGMSLISKDATLYTGTSISSRKSMLVRSKGEEKNTIQVNVKELLHDVKDRVLSAEIHYNPHTTEIASDIEGVKYFDIFTGKEIEKQ